MDGATIAFNEMIRVLERGEGRPSQKGPSEKSASKSSGASTLDVTGNWDMKLALKHQSKFPVVVAKTTLQPDIVIWLQFPKRVILVELTTVPATFFVTSHTHDKRTLHGERTHHARTFHGERTHHARTFHDKRTHTIHHRTAKNRKLTRYTIRIFFRQFPLSFVMFTRYCCQECIYVHIENLKYNLCCCLHNGLHKMCLNRH